MTDMVQPCGGSSRLLKLLNRLGVCASIETHGRYVQYRVEKRTREGQMSGYPENSFMIVSADNLDYVHKYTRSFNGKLETSWHGTTIQIVQPKPNLLTDSLTTPNTPSATIAEPLVKMGKRLYSTRSPLKNSPCPKRSRRRRTGLELTLENSDIGDYFIQSIPHVQMRDEQAAPPLEISYFLLQKEEQAALTKLQEVCEQYILLKVSSKTHSKHLINLQTYYSLLQNIAAPEMSNIIYYKVLDQKCDNKERPCMLSIINDLYTEFIVNAKNTYVIIEGDQVRYERLQSLKSEYGDNSSWLIPFVGDWHFLTLSPVTLFLTFSNLFEKFISIDWCKDILRNCG